jgi:hypothetical protein
MGARSRRSAMIWFQLGIVGLATKLDAQGEDVARDNLSRKGLPRTETQPLWSCRWGLPFHEASSHIENERRTWLNSVGGVPQGARGGTKLGTVADASAPNIEIGP